MSLTTTNPDRAREHVTMAVSKKMAFLGCLTLIVAILMIGVGEGRLFILMIGWVAIITRILQLIQSNKFSSRYPDIQGILEKLYGRGYATWHAWVIVALLVMGCGTFTALYLLGLW